MANEKDDRLSAELTNIAHHWRALGGDVIVSDAGLTLCVKGYCVEVERSTLRRLGRWALAAVRTIGRKLGLPV